MKKALFNWKHFVMLQLLAMVFLILIKPWQPNGDQIIHWDVSIYYAYLPATFIYNDVGIEQDWPVDMPKHQLILMRPHSGKELLKMSMGMTYMYAPFFFVAHAVALLSPEVVADGFSLPYQLALAFAGVFWAIVGVYFLFLFLSRFVTNRAAALSVAAVFVGTNLLYYTFWEGAMSHASLFGLMALVLEINERYLNKQTIKKAFLLGLLGGIIILIRPIMVLPLFGLVVFDVFRLKGAITWQHVPLVVLGVALPWLPQLLYWHFITGSWIYYSYEGEHFFFNDPQILNGLFSWRKGWLLYSPIMGFSLLGFAFLFQKQRAWFWLIAPLFLTYIFVIYSWWCWWYGGSYGSRPMIEFYPLLALPLAFLLDNVLKRWWKTIPVLLVIFALAAYNVFQIWQYKQTMLHWDSMTEKTYKAIFLKTQWPENYVEMLQAPNYEAAKKGER